VNFAHGEMIERLRAPLVSDPYSGQPTTRDWANATSATLEGFALDPGGSQETRTVSREQITTTPTLYGPYGADLVAADRVVVRGVTWEISGNAADWRSPFTGWTPGSVWPLTRVEG
jgi:hypothetical protein